MFVSQMCELRSVATPHPKVMSEGKLEMTSPTASSHARSRRTLVRQRRQTLRAAGHVVRTLASLRQPRQRLLTHRIRSEAPGQGVEKRSIDLQKLEAAFRRSGVDDRELLLLGPARDSRGR